MTGSPGSRRGYGPYLPYRVVLIMNLVGVAGFLSVLVYGAIFGLWPMVGLFAVLSAFQGSLVVFLLKIGSRGWDRITGHRQYARSLRPALMIMDGRSRIVIRMTNVLFLAAFTSASVTMFASVLAVVGSWNAKVHLTHVAVIIVLSASWVNVLVLVPAFVPGYQRRMMERSRIGGE